MNLFTSSNNRIPAQIHIVCGRHSAVYFNGGVDAGDANTSRSGISGKCLDGVRKIDATDKDEYAERTQYGDLFHGGMIQTTHQ